VDLTRSGDHSLPSVTALEISASQKISSRLPSVRRAFIVFDSHGKGVVSVPRGLLSLTHSFHCVTTPTPACAHFLVFSPARCCGAPSSVQVSLDEFRGVLVSCSVRLDDAAFDVLAGAYAETELGAAEPCVSYIRFCEKVRSSLRCCAGSVCAAAVQCLYAGVCVAAAYSVVTCA
jgi:hypothetical protein